MSSGRRIDPDTRRRIVETYLADPAAANAIARELGLDDWYAYKVANESGRLQHRRERT